MQHYPQVLADIVRIQQFSLLARDNPFSGQTELQRDSSGHVWAVASCHSPMAIPLLGDGWHFDLAARTRWQDRHTDRLTLLATMTDSAQEKELGSLTERFRFGPLSERLVWVIHREILRQRCSCIEIPDTVIRDAVWDGRVPKHWRAELRRMFASLSLLHLTRPSKPSGFVAFGDNTAVLTHFKVRNRSEHTDCPEGCVLAGGEPHTHVLVNVGRGFLGCLEDLAANQVGVAIRHYQLDAPSDDHEVRQSKEQLLRRVGKGGTLTSIYLPAVIGNREICASFSSKQRELFQVLFRERTRVTKKKRGQIAEMECFQGQMVAAVAADRRGRPAPTIPCEHLTASDVYVGFNGNGKRKGRGYKLSTWASKAHYQQSLDFLRDVRVLSERLGLIVAAINPATSMWVGISDLIALVHNRPCVAERHHVRFYAPADVVERWGKLFGWSTEISREAMLDNATVAKGILLENQVTQRAAARAIGIDASAFSKMLKGRRKLPNQSLQRLREWVATRDKTSTQPQPARYIDSSRQTATPPDTSMLACALEYRRRGWSVIPQLLNAKQPAVKWKAFQTELPSESQICQWWERWPDAGIILIAGELSGVLVVDVDSQEAKEVLTHRLGEIPLVPTSQSGSQDPHRFHLFFQHPAIPTKAKSTPWHPKLEFRGNAGLVVLPPSLHKSGNSYRWQVGRALSDAPLGPVPATILEALTPAPAKCPVCEPGYIADPEVTVAGSTKDFLAGKWAEGPGWNERLFQAACDLQARNVPLAEASTMLIQGARPWDRAEHDKAARTIDSAYAVRRERSVR
ncbi:bifunctional DNA primase/polymerase [Lignipirellula cremea]|uniref:DNA primase/polymerase bifunctional N-terminal domain-containing protein n=1 Tax=Lignipirellula cremea TaxID=2528010 RepID=A0A518DWM4_9BACT|nr:bifunctional DNA primase/polymerase [Lignipirellula cremea]QDU96231.1 hypothetical protein Pla8534_40500 [Lignipirellula cremea]